MYYSKHLAYVGVSLLLTGCFTTSDKSTNLRTSQTSETTTVEEDSDVSRSMTTFTQSLTNNRETSLSYSEDAAASFAQSIASSLPKERGRDKLVNAAGLVAAYQMSNAPTSDLLMAARTMMIEKMSKQVDSGVPDSVMVNLAIGAMKRKNYALSENYIAKLLKSKNSKVLAMAHTLNGILELASGRVPEAVVAWKTALKSNSGLEAAKFNLGFVALKNGRYDEAKSFLSTMQDDWFALSGLAVASYMLGDAPAADSYCKKSIRMNSKNKSTLFNCGVMTFLAKGDLAEGREMLQNAVKAPGSTKTDEEIYNYLEKMERISIERKRNTALEKAKEAAQQRASEPAPATKPTPKSTPAPAKSTGTTTVDDEVEDAFDD